MEEQRDEKFQNGFFTKLHQQGELVEWQGRDPIEIWQDMTALAPNSGAALLQINSPHRRM